MNFDFTDTQKDIRKAAREFAEGELTDIAMECDAKEAFPREAWKKACELGFVGVFIDERYGGAGLGFMENVMIMEEFWRVDGGCGNLILTAFGAEIIQKFGTEAQKARYLPMIPTGEAISGVAITEPDAGSDILMASTSAVADGDEWVINGSKMFITNGSIADFILVFRNHRPGRRQVRQAQLFHRRGGQAGLRGDQDKGQDGHTRIRHRRAFLQQRARPGW